MRKIMTLYIPIYSSKILRVKISFFFVILREAGNNFEKNRVTKNDFQNYKIMIKFFKEKKKKTGKMNIYFNVFLLTKIIHYKRNFDFPSSFLIELSLALNSY